MHSHQNTRPSHQHALTPDTCCAACCAYASSAGTCGFTLSTGGLPAVRQGQPGECQLRGNQADPLMRHTPIRQTPTRRILMRQPQPTLLTCQQPQLLDPAVRHAAQLA